MRIIFYPYIHTSAQIVGLFSSFFSFIESEMDSPSFEGFHAQLDCKLT